MILYEWFLKGGILMWPLLICSVIALAVAFDRFWQFFRASLNYERLASHLANHANDLPALHNIFARFNHHNPVVQIGRCFLNYRDYPESKRNQMLQRDGSRILATFDRHLKILGAIAQAAPLIGLLGTVLGLVTAFQQIQTIGASVQPSDLAGGIWAALVTTVAGLAIAIPCALAHQYFLARLAEMRRHMREIIIDLDAMTGLPETLEPPTKPQPARQQTAPSTHTARNLPELANA